MIDIQYSPFRGLGGRYINYYHLKRVIFRLFIILYSFNLISCEKEDDKCNLSITSGTACGWCAGTDSVIITAKKTIYEYNSPCDNRDLSIIRTTNSRVWNRLMKTMDRNRFNSIELNSCDVCADGCDTWIMVKEGNESHRIRYGYSDAAEIENIRPFTELLDSIRNSFREE